MIQNKYFDIYLENPLKTYKKIKKYFLPLKVKIEINFGKSNKAKIFELNSFDVLWKDKYNTPRHEFNPRIMLSLFNYIHLYVWFNVEDSLSDMVYWESALTWLYYDRGLCDSVKECTGWTQFNEEGEEEFIKFKLLKEPYQTLLENNKLKNIKYENTTR
jgi:hypothetical protein